MVQLREEGTELWISSVNRADSDNPTFYAWTKAYTFPASSAAASIAVISTEETRIRMLATFADGGMHSYTWDTSTRTMVSKDLTPTSAEKRYTFNRLTSDGNRLYGTRGAELFVMTSPSTVKRPSNPVKVDGFNTYARSFFGNAATPDGELSWTDYTGTLRIGDIKHTSAGWSVTHRNVTDRDFPEFTLTSPGGGILLRDMRTGELWRHHLDTDRVSTSTATSLAASTGAPDLPISTNPDTCTGAAPADHPALDDLTYTDLRNMFGSKTGTDQARVEAGLPSLVREMKDGGVTNTARIAAFLASVAAESNFYYDISEVGSTATYRGRGYMQITGEGNYRAAGAALGTSFVYPNQGRVATLTYSAPSALWHWNEAWGVSTSGAADQMDMGTVSQRVGFAGSEDPSNSERLRRCADFKRAYTYLSGRTPTDVTC